MSVIHPSHRTRSSDASTYDTICDSCGATDAYGDYRYLADQCPSPGAEGGGPAPPSPVPARRPEPGGNPETDPAGGPAPDPADVAWFDALVRCPAVNSVWRHRTRGTTYLVLGPALLEDGLRPAVRYRPVRGGPEWIRPLAEFLDGRFEEAP